MVNLTDPIFNNENKARAHLEALRWPDGPICPHCGSVNNAAKLRGKSTRAGVYKCRGCRKPFSVTVGTLFERSKIPLHKWVLAFHLMASSKKGISAHQLHRLLGITYKSAWFMAHRIREAMRDEGSSGPLGGEGKVVEADETYFGGKKKGVRGRKRQGPGGKNKVVTLVERGGPVRSFKVAHADAETVRGILFTNASRKSQLMTDESGIYTSLGIHFASHRKVMHSAGEYVKRDDRTVHSNTVENYFSVFKRGMRGVYQHCGEQHLHRYLAEFDFRYSTRAKLGFSDNERACIALVGIGGKRLTYQQSASR